MNSGLNLLLCSRMCMQMAVNLFLVIHLFSSSTLSLSLSASICLYIPSPFVDSVIVLSSHTLAFAPLGLCFSLVIKTLLLPPFRLRHNQPLHLPTPNPLLLIPFLHAPSKLLPPHHDQQENHQEGAYIYIYIL